MESILKENLQERQFEENMKKEGRMWEANYRSMRFYASKGEGRPANLHTEKTDLLRLQVERIL